MKIITNYVHPPIGIRWHDWVAYVDGQDNEDSHTGVGETEQEAISDLIWQFDQDEWEEYNDDLKSTRNK